jgi:hypothetical protein
MAVTTSAVVALAAWGLFALFVVLSLTRDLVRWWRGRRTAHLDAALKAFMADDPTPAGRRHR